MNKTYKTKTTVIATFVVLAAVSTAFARNFAFPSPLPPTGGGPGTPGWDTIRQIVSFIWDDNAYSGKNGSNYECSFWVTAPADASGSRFANTSWVGGRREEAAHMFANNRNTDNVKDGDFGMAWATKTLSGYNKDQVVGNMFFNPNFWMGHTYKLGDRFVAWSESAQKLQLYEIVVSPYGFSGGDKWTAGKSIDAATFSPDEQVCETLWNGEQNCLPLSSASAWQLSQHAQATGKFFKLISDEAIVAGAPVRTNPDGSNFSMTFNIISGQIIPAVNRLPGNAESSANRQSKWGFWVPNALFGPTDFGGVAIAWGREYPIMLQSWDASKDMITSDKGGGFWMDFNGSNGQGGAGQMQVPGYLNIAYQEAIELGHEIGNHTIDHLETNSMLPYGIGTGVAAFPGFANAANNAKLLQSTSFKEGFARWGGQGYDREGVDEIVWPDGQKSIVDEAAQFGQAQGAPQQFMGWVSYAGRILSADAWAGLIKIGEEEIRNYLDLRAQNNQVVAFRAPRLEVNSQLFYGLVRASTTNNIYYDTGNQEGFEYNVDGTNFVWPYTMDNGTPNIAWQRMVGTNVSNWDSLPSGIWQYPVSVFIVPEGHRESIWNNYNTIMTAGGTPLSNTDRDHFMRIGKITGFDFNLFILHGATKEAALATLKHSLDARLRGGKAPFQIGCHTDYFTPIYDNATLLNATNKDTYGLVVTNGWNTWRDRISVFEDFVAYAHQNGAYIWSGKQTIDYVRSLSSQVKVGATKTPVNNWTFFTHGNKSTVSGNLASGADITTTQTATNTDLEIAGFSAPVNFSEGFDHISLKYSTTAPITIRLITGDDLDYAFPYEVTLNNLNGFNNWDGSREVNKERMVESHEIPLSAFQRNQYVTDDLRGLHFVGTDFAKRVTAIEIAVQTPLVSSLRQDVRARAQTQRNWLKITDFTVHSGERTSSGSATEPPVTGVTARNVVNAPRTAIMGMTANNLNLSIARAGVYNVDIITANGRVVQSFRDRNLNAGVNQIPLSRLATGMYMIRIHNRNFNTTLRSIVR